MQNGPCHRRFQPSPLFGLAAIYLVSGTLPFAGLAPTTSDPGYPVVVVDAHGPKDPWTKIAGDLDGDGRDDVVVAGQHGPLVWYHSPTWSRHLIARDGWNTVGGAVADLDRDGDADVVLGGTLWYENPGNHAKAPDQPWPSHRIAEDPTHDVAIADLDGDGRPDVVTRNQSEFGARKGDKIRVWLQRPGGQWSGRTIAAPHGEGLALGDLDGDGAPDLVIGGTWYQTVREADGLRWSAHPFAEFHSNATIAIADFSGDGRPDVALAPSELAGQTNRLSWFEAPADPRAARWSEHLLVPVQECVVHALAAADMDGDGRTDLIFGEMHQGVDPDDVGIWFNRSGPWTRQIVDTRGTHGLQLLDFDGDGDPDILGANWSGAHQSVQVWVNPARRPRF